MSSKGVVSTIPGNWDQLRRGVIELLVNSASMDDEGGGREGRQVKDRASRKGMREGRETDPWPLISITWEDPSTVIPPSMHWYGVIDMMGGGIEGNHTWTHDSAEFPRETWDPSPPPQGIFGLAYG